ncbi:MAG TPA: hypothetical protein VGM25_12705 [Caulobacteraceae bacterium]
MLRKLLAVVFLAAGFLVPACAWASGDYGCSVSWTLRPADPTECDNHPFLSPTNDSRVNLHLLLLDAGKAQLDPGAPAKWPADRYPAQLGLSPFMLEDLEALIEPRPTPAPGEAIADNVEGEGSRCNSNAAGARQFAAALGGSAASPADRAALLAARAALKPGCVDNPDPVAASAPPVQAASPMGKAFAAYLAGAAAFYDGRYDPAAQSFGSLQASPHPWLKETARYMLGRVALNRAQAGASDEFGRLDLAKIDAKAVAAARTAFEAYLHDYPNGAYAVSARGLLRRVDWLGGKDGDLSRDVAQALGVTDPKARNVTEVALVREADSKLMSREGVQGTAISDPLLLAAFDLMHMRGRDPTVLTHEILDAQKPIFAGHEALFDYLRAAYLFQDDKNPGAALALLPKTTPSGPMTYLEFSRQVLKGLALEETGDHAGARALWLALMPAARPPLQHADLELALALNYERSGSIDQVFAAGSPITDPDLRELLLTNSAGPDLLRRQAQASAVPERERRLALYTLLYKELTRDRYAAFVKDLALLPPAEPARAEQTRPEPDLAPFRWDGQTPEGYVCPPLKTLAQSLAQDPAKAESRICLDEAARLGGLDGSLGVPLMMNQLGSAPSQFPGGPYSRLESYKALLADPKTPAAVRTYALYRAVQCYAPSGYNGCGGKDAPKSQRKAWFQTLKTTYAGSVWAKRLKYYW